VQRSLASSSLYFSERKNTLRSTQGKTTILITNVRRGLEYHTQGAPFHVALPLQEAAPCFP
jgi:hypothetical protein